MSRSSCIIYHYVHDRWWHATGTGPRTACSRASFFPYIGASSDIQELAQTTRSLDTRVTIQSGPLSAQQNKTHTCYKL